MKKIKKLNGKKVVKKELGLMTAAHSYTFENFLMKVCSYAFLQ